MKAVTFLMMMLNVAAALLMVHTFYSTPEIGFKILSFVVFLMNVSAIYINFNNWRKQ